MASSSSELWSITISLGSLRQPVVVSYSDASESAEGDEDRRCASGWDHPRDNHSLGSMLDHSLLVAIVVMMLYSVILSRVKMVDTFNFLRKRNSCRKMSCMYVCCKG